MKPQLATDAKTASANQINDYRFERRYCDYISLAFVIRLAVDLSASSFPGNS
jgi:hypothetical protein